LPSRKQILCRATPKSKIGDQALVAVDLRSRDLIAGEIRALLRGRTA
jgi:hypothetical protein